MSKKDHPVVNLKLANKFRFAFLFLVAVSIALVTIGIININNQVELGKKVYLDSTMPISFLSNMQVQYDKITGFSRDIADATTGATAKTAHDGLPEPMLQFTTYFDSFIETVPHNPQSAQEKQAIIDNITANFKEFNIRIEELMAVAQDGNRDVSLKKYETTVRPLLVATSSDIEKLSAITLADAEIHASSMDVSKKQAIILMMIAMTIAIVFCIGLEIYARHLIIRPINLVAERARRVAKGHFDTDVRLYGLDEIGELSRSVDSVSRTYFMLITELKKMVVAHNEGDTDYRIDINKFDASYREAIGEMNEMVNTYIVGTFELLDCVNGIGQGNFDAPLKQFPGKKKIANEIVDTLRHELKDTSNAISKIAESVKNGDLTNRADDNLFSGDWKTIMGQLNQMLDAVAKPIEESTTVLTEFAKGKLTTKIEGNYRGSFEQMKKSLNETNASVAGYIQEIANVLNKVKDNQLNVSITRDFVGDFSQIKSSVNTIITKFNDVLTEINTATEQVSSGARLISESSADLAIGANEQNQSIIQLTQTIEGIKEKTLKNAENSAEANRLSLASTENATHGNDEMKRMLDSMQGIKESSNNISKIIKVIEDIAFQTNLLALNAAVEAARAGEHGKGFAVVAEEVRSLASRSSKAAGETTLLIEDSIKRVTEGTKIASETAHALEKIVSDVASVSTIISAISIASNEQNSAIEIVSDGITRISEVVQNNSINAKESAGAAQTLSNQSDSLKKMTGIFEL